jgi:hypothetical protein
MWSDLELPPPEAQGYGYSIDAGLVRTTFDTAKPRQGRKHTSNKRTFTAEVKLRQAQLKIAINFLETYGYTWFSIELLSGEYSDAPVSPHCVRLAEAYTITAIGADLYSLQMVLEQLVETTITYTTTLYPLDAYERVLFGIPDPDSSWVDMDVMHLVREEIAFLTPAPADFSADLDQINWNSETAEPESLSFTTPDPADFDSTFIASNIGAQSPEPEAIALSLPAKITGKLQ